MLESLDPNLAERVTFLEEKVAALQRQVEHLQQEAQTEEIQESTPLVPFAQPEIPPTGPPEAPAKRTTVSFSALKDEDWLNKLGIALLLLGLAFLFKLGVDRGLLTPVVRVAFGGALGISLFGAGLRLHSKRVHLGQVLLGGGIATFYATLFAAYQLYSLLPYAIAFSGMGTVTLLGFVLAIRQHDTILAVIATVGGLGTPFLLYTTEGSIPGLVVYTCVVLSSSMGIFLYKGSRLLLTATVVGGWLVFAVPALQFAFQGAPDRLVDQLVFQGGVFFCWLVFGGIPVLRAIWRHQDPDHWSSQGALQVPKQGFTDRPALLLTLIVPLVALIQSALGGSYSGFSYGLIKMGAAGLYGLMYYHLRRWKPSPLASMHGVTAMLLLSFSWMDVLEDRSSETEVYIYLALALQATLIHVVARRLLDQYLHVIAHLIHVVVVVWLTGRLLDLDATTPVLINGPAIIDLTVMALLLSSAWLLRQTEFLTPYSLAAYMGLLGWFWRDLVALPNGQAYVSIAWGICALVLLMIGWYRSASVSRRAGLVTLLIVIGKLFIIDLAELEAVWRVLLFLGFGGLLLLLSYFFPKLRK